MEIPEGYLGLIDIVRFFREVNKDLSDIEVLEITLDFLKSVQNPP